MVSREHKSEDYKLQCRLRSIITDSRAKNETSKVVDAINSIKELKHKVERLIIDEDMKTTAETTSRNTIVSVETLGKGFLVKVQYSGKSFPGLLVSILEAFEELGLNVLEARVSCSDSFLLQALIGAENEEEEEEESINAQMVKKAISNTINIWNENNDQ